MCVQKTSLNYWHFCINCSICAACLQENNLICIVDIMPMIYVYIKNLIMCIPRVILMQLEGKQQLIVLFPIVLFCFVHMTSSSFLFKSFVFCQTESFLSDYENGSGKILQSPLCLEFKHMHTSSFLQDDKKGKRRIVMTQRLAITVKWFLFIPT